MKIEAMKVEAAKKRERLILNMQVNQVHYKLMFNFYIERLIKSTSCLADGIAVSGLGRDPHRISRTRQSRIQMAERKVTRR
jgi:hypothetical protein